MSGDQGRLGVRGATGSNPLAEEIMRESRSGYSEDEPKEIRSCSGAFYICDHVVR